MTLNYHWDDRKKLEDDFIYLEDFYKKLLINLAAKLCVIHKKNYDLRFWEITLGYWLQVFLNCVYDRWEVLSNLDTNKQYFLKQIEFNIDDLVSNNTSDSINNYINDYWNSFMFREILSYKYSIKNHKTFYKKRIELKKNIASNYFLKIFSRFFKKNTSVILDVKLSFYKSIMLFFKANSIYFPTKFYNHIDESEFDESKRDWVLNLNPSNEFEVFISKTISYHIPKIFIEGFENISNQVNESILPKSPKNILSLNSIFSNDFFSFYMAFSKLSGTRILSWQHGGFYGIGKFSVYENYQISVSDSFFSWGWKNNNAKVTPLGYYAKEYKNICRAFKSKENILFVNTIYPRYSYNIYSTYISSQSMNYLRSQLNFVKNLDKRIFTKMIFKFPSYDYGWEMKTRFIDSFPKIKIYNGNKTAKDLLKTAKISICSYNGTFFLESLKNNTPTLIFFDKEFCELNKYAIPMFNLLKDHLIFHETSLSAANHLNKIYDNVEEWWFEKNLQNSLKRFINLYCKSYKVQNLISLLNI